MRDPLAALADDAVPLDVDWLNTCAESARYIQIVGGPGTGKTTALKHLAHLAGSDTKVVFLDEPSQGTIVKYSGRSAVVFTSRRLIVRPISLRFQLAPWGRDEIVEYLLAVRPERCRSVMNRLQAAVDSHLFSGEPELWRIVLDAMIADDSIATVRHALTQALADQMRDEAVQAAAEQYSYASEIQGRDIVEFYGELRNLAADGSVYQMLRHKCVRKILAAGYLAWLLEGEHAAKHLPAQIPFDFLACTAEELAPRAIDNLQELLVGGPPNCHAMAASLLHATKTPWQVPSRAPVNLAGAYLRGTKISHANLEGANLHHVDFSLSEMDAANLARAVVNNANFSHAELDHAILSAIQGENANFAHAVLTHADCTSAKLQNSLFRRANLSDACLANADMQSADLTGARFTNADLTKANLMGARIDDADFTSANLNGAYLDSLPLRKACFNDADFSGAFLTGCNMEEINLAGVDFMKASLCNALLTGSIMTGACFVSAKFSGARLADIQWEGANLRFADLRECIFHLGSTRCGMVDSPLACEGSRMDFYSDDFDSQTYRPPEEIRKANLCGADLRDALLDGTDFYLVDLRGAQYTNEQFQYLSRCRAILFDRS